MAAYQCCHILEFIEPENLSHCSPDLNAFVNMGSFAAGGISSNDQDVDHMKHVLLLLDSSVR